jgi:hypothetical protein
MRRETRGVCISVVPGVVTPWTIHKCIVHADTLPIPPQPPGPSRITPPTNPQVKPPGLQIPPRDSFYPFHRTPDIRPANSEPHPPLPVTRDLIKAHDDHDEAAIKHDSFVSRVSGGSLD